MAKPRKMTPVFLRLLLAKLENPKLSNKDFIALSKVYAQASGVTKPAVKAGRPKNTQAPILTETEQIMEIEAAQRKSNG